MGEPVATSFTLSGGAGNIVGDYWAPTPTTATSNDGGGQDSPPILMLHGGAQTRHSWDRAARSLAEKGHEVTTVDTRGHGDSDWAPDGDYKLSSLADDLRIVVTERFSADRLPVIVGASLGGLTGMVALGRGDAVGVALVLVDVSPRMEAAGVDRIGDFMRSGIDGFDSLEAVADAVSAYQPHRPRPKNVDGLKKNLRQREDGRWYWHWDPAFAQNASGSGVERGQDYLEGFARNVQVPTMLLRGSHSDVIAEDAGERLREIIPHVYTHEVNDAGHMIVGDDNAVFLDNLEWFMEQLG